MFMMTFDLISRSLVMRVMTLTTSHHHLRNANTLLLLFLLL